MLDKIKTNSLIACSNRCFKDQDQLLETFFKLQTPPLPIPILLIMRLFKKMPKKIEINYPPSIVRSFSHTRFLFQEWPILPIGVSTNMKLELSLNAIKKMFDLKHNKAQYHLVSYIMVILKINCFYRWSCNSIICDLN